MTAEDHPILAPWTQDLIRSTGYPEFARRAQVEGLVRLNVRVNPSGRADSLSVLHPTPHPILVDAAKEAVQKMRFAPGPVDTTHIRIGLNFSLYPPPIAGKE
ncbi:hypothetical protein BSZ36_06050 [Rubricoccus marinus]|uniref:TonB C-terminal domain-containing protein n=2 Tax=Rubricoccus marinus TaxID=716817 RepID=A0A259TYC5_9BACT|nr:hypothetical protein BSZ36_06050 [Rubricoccus marinus]